MHEPTWRSPKSGPQWRASLETYAHPVIGDMPVSEITPGHVMAVLQPIWNGKRETARRVKQRISAICRWAVAQGHRTDDPAGVVIDAALPRNGVERRPMPALPYEEVAGCIAKVRASRRAGRPSKLALEFLILTAARSAEVRKATWDEIDREGATWTVPAERMKTNREHRVPLSERALDVLAEAAELSNGTGLVFPGTRPGRPISANTHAKLLREPRLRRGDARVPVELQGLRIGTNPHAARGHGGGARPRHQEQGGGGLRPQRPIREAAAVDGCVGAVSDTVSHWQAEVAERGIHMHERTKLQMPTGAGLPEKGCT